MSIEQLQTLRNSLARQERLMRWAMALNFIGTGLLVLLLHLLGAL